MRPARFPDRMTLSGRLAGFVDHLRAHGYGTGLGQHAAARDALAAIDPTEADAFYLAMAAVCANSQDRRARFRGVFDAYWTDHARRRESAGETPERRESGRRTTLLESSLGEAGSGGKADVPDPREEGEVDMSGQGRLTAVRREQIRKTDLRHLVSTRDLDRARTIARQLAEAMRDRRSRRRRAARRGMALDLRRIARRSTAHGGEPLELLARRRPDRPVRITAFLDVSGSMQVYASVFLAFLRGLASADRRLDAYLMHTHLVRVTEALRGSDTMSSLGRMSLMASGFGGGTRLGTCLDAFIGQHGASIGSRTVVMILSDGYDSDPPGLLAQSLARIRRRGSRIVWLNPLKGWAGYEPVARSMAAALPFLDHFAAANTLDALAALEGQLAAL